MIEVRKFSTKSAYIQFGKDNNIAVEKSLLIGEHLSHIADSAGVIAYYNSTGLVPSWYSNYETTYINGLGVNTVAQDRGPLNMLYKGCGQSSSIPVWITYPFMPSGWNDKTRKVQYLGVVYSGLSMFDNVFYRRHLGIVRGYTFDSVCLVGTVADLRMSSCISL